MEKDLNHTLELLDEARQMEADYFAGVSGIDPAAICALFDEAQNYCPHSFVRTVELDGAGVEAYICTTCSGQEFVQT